MMNFGTNTDFAWVGLIVVPIGLAICFGPALLVWIVQEFKAESEDEPKAKTKN
jgi:hypothetical protein